MKKFIVSLVLIISLSGCMSPKVGETVQRAVKRTDDYVELIDRGQTTPEKDQAFIKAMNVYHHVLNYYANGVEPPESVRAALVEAGLLEE